MRHKSLPQIRNRIIMAAAALICATSAFAAPLTVGIHGNEPLITTAPDGTLYISALQHLYRSTDDGATWTELPGPIYSSTLNLNSDSSISVDPGNRLYFTFDYPYAGSTAVCVSDDRGDTWSCNPAVVPGGTDRMWTFAPSTSAAYEVTNEGLYETTFLSSTDRGQTWTPRAVGSGLLEPQTGPLLQKRCSKFILQVTKIFGNSPEEEDLKFYVYDPTSTTALISDVRSTGLKLPVALPSAAFAGDDMLWVVTEEDSAAKGRQVVVARSADEGKTWTKLPPLPATTTGTATFTWIAAGEPGHIGVIYYYTPDNGTSPALTDSTWSVVWAESRDANTANPTWTFTTLEENVHKGPICAAADCSGTNRFAGDFISAILQPNGVAHLTWMKQDNGTGAVSIRYERIQSGSPIPFTPPSCSPTPTPAASASPSPSVSASPSPTATPANLQLVNISGRSMVQTDDNVAIAGFIVQGSGLKRVIVRGLGPSLRDNGVPVAGALQDPILELRDAQGGSVTNDNWRSSPQASEIEQTNLAPPDDRESAIVASLPSGNYTAIVRGVNNTTGIGLAEVYDLNSTNGTQLGNLSVRANVLTEDNVLIDGVIVHGGSAKRVLFRGIGPELHDRGVTGELSDPAMELHDENGALMASNDNWRNASNASEIEASGLAPTNDREPAILLTLSPGNYTSITRGVNSTTGIALAEAYKLD